VSIKLSNPSFTNEIATTPKKKSRKKLLKLIPTDLKTLTPLNLINFSEF
jgi:hypothetical protein